MDTIDVYRVVPNEPNEKLKPEAVAQALRESAGIQAAAARRLGVNRHTIARYVRRYPTVAQAAEDGRAVLLDLAETKLLEHLQRGNLAAVTFTLRTIGRDRGYVERQELAATTSSPLKLEWDDDE